VTDAKDPKLALFELYLATAEKVSDRRAQANSWMLSVNSAIVALLRLSAADKMAVSAGQEGVWLWAIPAAGAVVCMAWSALLASYRKLNRAKFRPVAARSRSANPTIYARARIIPERPTKVAFADRKCDPWLFHSALRHHARRGDLEMNEVESLHGSSIMRADGRRYKLVITVGRTCSRSSFHVPDCGAR
jgi:hypothetical protein